MDLLNQRGLECVGYKEELLKGYPPLVQGALIDKVQGLLTAQILTLEVYEYIVDPKVKVNELIEFLLELTTYTKSKEERLKEMESFQTLLVEYINQQVKKALQYELQLTTESLVIACPFKIGLETTMEFFNVNQKQAVELMKRKGFVEKFAVLRLEAIFKEFLLSNSFSFKEMSIEKSLVYVDSSTGEYGIDVLIHIPFDYLKQAEQYPSLATKTKQVVDSATQFYYEKMGKPVPVLIENEKEA